MEKFFILLVVFCSFCFGEKENDLKIASVPKSGTHLLIKVLGLMKIVEQHDPWKIHLGQHCPPHFSKKQILNYFSAGKSIVIVRDMRDFFVSYVNWVEKRTRIGMEPKPKDPDYLNLPFQYRLSSAICGVDPCDLDWCLDAYRVASILKDAKLDNVLIIHFEDLVGERGGGRYAKTVGSIRKNRFFL